MKTRILTGLCYLGFAPEIGLFGWADANPAQRRHVQGGLVLSFLGVCLLAFCLGVQLLEYLIVSRSAVILYNLVYVLDVLSFGPLVGWVVLLCVCLWRSWRDPQAGMPLVSRLVGQRSVLFCALCSSIAWQVLVVVVIAVALRANYLARPQSVSVIFQRAIAHAALIRRQGIQRLADNLEA